MKSKKILHLLTLLALAFSLLMSTTTAHAFATIWYVKSTGDGVATPANCPGNGCRLRDAIAAAAPGDTILFNLPAPSIIALTNLELSIQKALTIQGPGSSQLTIHGNDVSHIFAISDPLNDDINVTISNMALAHGRALDTNGGAILNQNATVYLNNLVITDNAVVSGVFNFLRGGGIYNGGVMTINNSQITNNTAPSSGGIYSSYGTTLTMTNVTVSGNRVSGGSAYGGGVVLDSDAGTSYASTANFDQVYITNNTADLGYGGLMIGNSANATITNSSISGNSAAEVGGVFIVSNASVTMSNTTISNNQSLAGNSGGIYVSPSASLTMTDSTISGNSAFGERGGVHGANTSTINLNNVTVSGNSASSAGGLDIEGTANLANVTITGNSVSANTGGMRVYGTANLNNVTLAGNSANNNTGGIYVSGSATVNIKNSIMADNTAPFTADCDGNINSQGYNLFENVDVANCIISGATSSNIIGVDPMLGALIDNGGSTLTMSLLPGSQAIDAANNTTCASEDQRSFLRPQDGDGDDTNVCDMGALEYAPYPVVFSITRVNPNPTSAVSVDYSVKFSEPVSNVDLGGFNITTTGVTGANIANVTGSGLDYTVTVNTGTGSGAIQLELIDDDSILSSFSGDPLGGPGTVNGSANGQTYDIDKTAPTILSSLRTSATPTNLASVDFTVTFSESVTGVNAGDFSLTTTGVSGAAVSGVSGSGSVYTISVNTSSGDGTIRLDVLDDDTIVDVVLNPLGAGFTSGETYTVTKIIPPPTTLVNSVLPTSRTVPVSTMATIFNTVINAGTNTAAGITLSMSPVPAGTFVYQQTDCATNAIIGSPNPSLDLAPGQVLCYVLSFTPSATFSATSVHIQAQAANAPSTNLLTGINTWLLRATDTLGPDIIALTTTTDFHQVACSGANAFAVALSNVGAAATGDITVTANTGSATLPLSISISETDPATGVVIGDHILQSVGAGENRTVAVFVTFNGCVAFDPAANRIFIEFRDASNNVVGSTSTAVSTNR